MESNKKTIVTRSVFRLMALIYFALGFVWLLVLSSNAWRFSAVFSSLGCISAAVALKYSPSKNDRILLWLLIVVGFMVFASAIISRQS